MLEDKNEEIACSPETEKMVLGHMLSEPQSAKRCSQVCTDADFYDPTNKIIFQAAKKVYELKEDCGTAPVCEQLRSTGMLNSVGGVTAITDVAQFAAADLSGYLDERIEQLKEQTKKRDLSRLALNMQARISNGSNVHDTIIEAQEQLRAIEKDKGVKDKFPIRFLNEFGEDFLKCEPQPKPMLLSNGSIGFLPKSIVGMLVGAGGVGKTHLLAQLAISVATGSKFLDTFAPTGHCGPNNMGNVFFGLGENQYDDIHRVLYKASKELRTKTPGLLNEASKRIAPFSFCGQQASFLTPEGNPSRYFKGLKMRLQDMAPVGGWQMIILDPVSRLMGVDAETDNGVATVFISLLEELTIDLPGNPTVLFAHHVSKGTLQSDTKTNQSAARGASAITDGVRWQINYVKTREDTSVLTMTKTNFTAMIDPITVTKDLDGFIRKSSLQKEEQRGTSSSAEKTNSPGRYVDG